MRATIGEAIGLNGGSEEIDLLSRRIDALNKRMLTLVNDTVSSGGDMESCEEEFKGISEQIEQLNSRIDAIRAAHASDRSYEERLTEIQQIEIYRKLCRHVYNRYPQLVGEHVTMFRAQFETANDADSPEPRQAETDTTE